MKYLLTFILLLVVAGSGYLAYISIAEEAPTSGITNSVLEVAGNSGVLEGVAGGEADQANSTASGDPLYSFMVFGDHESNIPVFQRIIEASNAEAPAFVVNTGDTSADRSEIAFQNFATEAEDLEAPLYNIAGNNDIGVDGTLDLYFEYVQPEQYYSWNFQGDTFIALYNVGESAFASEQLDWLEDELGTANGKIFLFMHKPIEVPFSELSGYNDGIDDERVNRFRDIIGQHEITHIYTGHAHTYFRYTLDGIPVTITGGGGGEPNVPLLFDPELPHHYTRVEVFEDGTKEEPVRI